MAVSLLTSKLSILPPFARSLRTSALRSCNKPTKDAAVPKLEDATSATASLRPGRNSHKVDELERRILVWTGKFKTINEVPAMVSQETMEKARNKARIKIANYMMLATAIGCIVMIFSGKRAADRGESVQKMNMDWHRSINEATQTEAPPK